MPATPSGVSFLAIGFAGCSGFPASISSDETRLRSSISRSRPASQIW
jgi:hypothetical protein